MSKSLSLLSSCVQPDVVLRQRMINNPGSPLERNFKMVPATADLIEAYKDSGRKEFKDGLRVVSETEPQIGEWVICEDTPTNLYEMIQSHTPACDLKYILARYNNGDLDALNQVAATYADVTNAPKNIAEAYAEVKRYEAEFERMPLELRKAFGNNSAAFFRAVADGSINNVIAQLVPQKESPAPAPTPAPTPASDVKEGVNNE